MKRQKRRHPNGVHMEAVTEEQDFADEKRAERKRPPPKPAKVTGSSSSKQDDRLVARVLHLARERTPLAQIDGILSAEGEIQDSPPG